MPVRDERERRCGDPEGSADGGRLMATVATELKGGFGIERDEPLAERLLALAGAAFGAENGAAFPVIWGGFGTMLGSALTAGTWYLGARLFVGSGTRPVKSAPGAG